MTHDDRAVTAAETVEVLEGSSLRDPLDTALRQLGAEILDEPVPESLLALFEAPPPARRAR